ncbi:FAD-binding oxidoreductase [Streptomyces sp. AP-93]|uniref:FAD-binding oxidoreductase n=1 Tax=Streptomyces sp. AP-93 TaxID=2929048 RepID=UPI001FAFF1F3|nr:FAD-binding protein [Streptomyces sp. AP-93]MCJ0871909.1 FAD-binding protein [Streptomyces sp. AP-93]
MTSTVTRRRFVAGTAAGAGAVALGTGAGLLAAQPAKAAEAAEAVFGPVTVGPSDVRYPDLVRGTNQRFVGSPDSVRVVGTTAQVVAAVQGAVNAGKRIAVRSGGHCYEDFVANPAVKVVIDMSVMNCVSYDSSRRAFVVEAGAKLGQVYERLFKGWGVTVPGGACPTVGAGGHIQGGGYGALSRKYGLISDYVYAVEVVTVNAGGTARAVVATREASDPNRDLWWAHTGGGGGNFGVVTRYWLRTPDATGSNPSQLLPQPPSEVWISTVNWPWAQLTRDGFSRLMKNYGEWHERFSGPTAPELSLFSELKPAHQAAGAVSLTTQVDASAPNAEQMLQAFIDYVGAGTGVTAQVAEHRKVSWLHATQWSGFTGPDPLFRFKGKPAYQRKNFTDSQIGAMYRHLTRTDYAHPGALMLISAYGGKVNTVAPDATAVAQRDSILKVQAAALWTDPADDGKHLTWLREFFRDLYGETGGVPGLNGVTDGMFINYADVDVKDPAWNPSGTPWQRLYYKDNYPALQQVKAKWDPRNVFRHALSIELPV